MIIVNYDNLGGMAESDVQVKNEFLTLVLKCTDNEADVV